MGDNPKIRDGRDRTRVSSQKHEIAYVARKTGSSASAVREAKATARSSSRSQVERKVAGSGSRSGKSTASGGRTRKSSRSRSA